MSLRTKILVFATAVVAVLGFLAGGSIIQSDKRIHRAEFEVLAQGLSSFATVSINHGEEGPTIPISELYGRVTELVPRIIDIKMTRPSTLPVDGRTVPTDEASGEVTSLEWTEVDGKSVVLIRSSIPNGAGCNTCHDRNETALGMLTISLDAQSITEHVRAERYFLAGLVGIEAVFFGLAMYLFIRRTVTRRLLTLNQRASEVACGDYSVNVYSGPKDEIGRLAESFELMTADLRNRSSDLLELQSGLEQQISDRTAELKRQETVRIRLLRRLTAAQEEERARIARDLHDEVGQSLTFLAARAESGLETQNADIEDLRSALHSVRETSIATIAEVRRIIAELRPEALDALGLAAALRWIVRTRFEHTDIAISTNITIGMPRIDRTTELTVYRVAQEALSNVVRHANATTVEVSLTASESSLHLTVADDGDGFDPQAILQNQLAHEGWGLAGMYERITTLNGTISIESEPGNGTVVIVEIPLV